MIPELGQLALILALLTAVVLGILPLIGAQTNRPLFTLVARPAAIALFIWVALAFICLMIAFIQNDFSVFNFKIIFPFTILKMIFMFSISKDFSTFKIKIIL